MYVYLLVLYVYLFLLFLSLGKSGIHSAVNGSLLWVDNRPQVAWLFNLNTQGGDREASRISTRQAIFSDNLVVKSEKEKNSEPVTLSNLNLRNQLQLEQKVKKSLGTGGSLINLKVKSGK